jgi:hypothetical protein
MTSHLPECPSKGVDCEVGDLGQCNCDEWHACICEALKACEERVRGEEQQRIEAALRSVGQHDAAWELAIRERTLREVMQRIEALPWTSETWNAHTERAAIIAAIKGDSDA